MQQAWRHLQALTAAVEDHRPLTAAADWVPVSRTGNPAVSAWLTAVVFLLRAAGGMVPAVRVRQWALAALLAPWRDPESLRAGRVPSGDAKPWPDCTATLVQRLLALDTVPAPTLATLRHHHDPWPGPDGVAPYLGAQWLGAVEWLTHQVFRTDGQAWSPARAWAALRDQAGVRWEAAVVEHLAGAVSPYAPGEVVRLTTGEAAVVQAVPGGHPERPWVRLLTGPAQGTVVGLADPAGAGRQIAGLWPHREWDAPPAPAAG
ncbi:MAG: hypothetical protein OWV35_06730 [Firmicutes bacterium]|nr:hypothetical protein [Bacillota bacterium]